MTLQPLRTMKPLLKQQKASKEKLQRVKVGAFFMEAGTGKTRPVLELAKEIEPDVIVWFTPFRTIENLKAELNKWHVNDIRVVGIESIQNSDRLYLEIYNLLSDAHRPVLIVDESLKIKNSDAKRTKRLLVLSQLCEYKFIMNGTPISRNLLDLWSQMEFLSPKILSMTEAQFKNSFCEYKKITIRKPGSYTERSKEWIVKYHNLDYLYKLIEPYVFECDLKLDIDKQYIDIKYELQEEEKTEHEAIINKILDNDWLMAKPNFFLELTQKLQNNYSRTKEKFDFVADILKKNDPSKVIIFAKYIETQTKLKKKFPNATILSYQKHSFGLNLQQFNRCIFFDKTWDYALREQAERRIYRTGQESECIFYDLTGNVGLESMMNGNMTKKADLLQEFKKLSLEEFKKQAI